MASYSNDLRLKEITTGDEDGTWGTSTNTNLSLIADAFGYGTKQLAADANETFTMPDASADGTRALYLKITSAVSLTATRTVTLGPNTVSKVWLIENATSGSESITVSQGSGSTVTIPNGDKVFVYTDGGGAGANVVNANPTSSTSGTVTSVDVSGGTTGLTTSGGPVTSSGTITLAGTLAVANGGTGATTASAARANLDVEPGVDVLAYDSNLQSFVTTFTLPTVDGSNGQVLTTNGSGALSFTTVSSGGGISLTDLSVGADGSPSGYGSLSYNDSTGVFTYTPPTASGISAVATSDIGSTVLAYDSNLQSFVTAFTLPTSDGTSGQVLTTNGSGTLSFTTVSSGGGISLTDLSVGADGSPSGYGSLSYNDSTGVFTYTPPTAAGIGAVSLTALSVGAEGIPSEDGSLSYNDSTGVFTYTPPTAAGIGAVTQVGLSTTLSGLSVSGSPITSSGTISLSGTLGISSGGTGATTASAARTALGLAIGANVQAYDADLTTLGGLAKTDGNFIVGNGTTWVVESGATARASLGLVIGADVQAYDANTVFSDAVSTTFSGTVNLTTLQLNSTTVTSSATELNILDGVTASTAELNILDGVTATTAELNILDGVTATTAELNILDGVTATTAELNILDGLLATTAELNILDGVTATTAELNILDGLLATTAELNILDGVTATTAELNILDGVTASTAELNYLDITTLGVQQASKALTANASNVVKLVGVQNTTYALSASGAQALNPNNGLFQYATLTGATTFTDSFSEGQEIILGLAIGGNFTITWPTIVWVTASGAAPSISNGDILYVIVYKVNGGLVATYNQYDV